jgi:hypothetical protein
LPPFLNLSGCEWSISRRRRGSACAVRASGRLPLESPTAGRSGQAIGAGEPGVDSEAYTRTTSLDGVTRVTLGAWSDNDAVSDIEGDTVCTFFATLGRRLCAAIFHNPSGSSAQKNEYHLLFPWRRFDFTS